MIEKVIIKRNSETYSKLDVIKSKRPFLKLNENLNDKIGKQMQFLIKKT